MKKLLFILALIPVFTFAQHPKAIPTDDFNSTNFSSDQQFFDVKTKTTAFLYDQSNEGYLIINDSISSSQKKIRYNLETGELFIGSEKGKSVLLTGQSITGFVINKNEENHRRVFTKISIDAFESPDIKRGFYEIIFAEEGADYLIKEVKKYTFGLKKNDGVQTNFPSEYKETVSYYIKNKSGKYVKTKLRKKNILRILEDKNLDIKAFASSNKINFKKESDIARVLDYYHKL